MLVFPSLHDSSFRLCIKHVFLLHSVKKDSTHTIGVEFGSKVVEVGGKNIKLQIWVNFSYFFSFFLSF